MISSCINKANDDGNLTQGVADVAGKILQPSFNVHITSQQDKSKESIPSEQDTREASP